jgi:putative endonuclease
VTAGRQRLGAAGEERAVAWYLARGYEVVARNWRCREGELDVIVRQGATIAICEVKARSSLAYGHPAEAVTAAKQRRIRALAARWLAEANPGPRPAVVRFDVAAVLPRSVDVIEGAF